MITILEKDLRRLKVNFIIDYQTSYYKITTSPKVFKILGNLSSTIIT